MTTEHEASRTLVKSLPELWAECSDAGGLTRHLGEFGDITITRLEPETTVAWEGEHASGTVRIEPSGWGTKVTLTARTRTPVLDSALEALPAGEAESIEAPPAEEGSAEIQEPEIESIPQEENDATLEEAAEDPDPPVAADRGALRIRWRRMTASMRGLFRPPEPAGAPYRAEPAAAEPVASIRPPDVAVAEPPEPSPIVAEPAESPAGNDGPCADEAEPAAGTSVDAELILTAALDSLGQAHHRPFSRA